MGSVTQPPQWKSWLLATRPRTLPAAAMPVCLAVCLAVHQGVAWQPMAAWLCLLFALLIQIGTNFSNDLEDFRSGADNEKRLGPGRAVQSGWISERTMSRAVWLVFGMAFATGSLLHFYTEGYWIFVLGILSILCGYAYTGGPYPLGYHGLGDLFSLLFFGLVAVMATYFIQSGELAWTAWWTGLAVGGLTTNLLVVNNHRDMDTDRVAGKRTLVVRWGRGFAEAEYICFVAIAWLWAPVLFWGNDSSAWVFAGWLAIPFWVRGIRALRRAQSREDYHTVLKLTSLALIVFGSASSIGLLV
jgi:1,4-dihydroxy-2-naphthoate octaprenyltransferase